MPVVSNRESLYEFCDKHKVDSDCIEIIREAGHLEIADAVARVIFGGVKNKKVKTVWIYGARDSGKSTAIDFIEEILCVQEL